MQNRKQTKTEAISIKYSNKILERMHPKRDKTL